MEGLQSEKKSKPAQGQFLSNPEALEVEGDGWRRRGWRRRKENPGLVSWKPREDFVPGRKSSVEQCSGRRGPHGAGG